MLETGHPPNEWTVLLAEARKENQRLRISIQRAASV